MRDARIVGIDRGGDEVGERHVGDEAAALIHLQNRLAAFRPMGDAHLAAQDSGIHADVGQRLGERECAAPGRAILTGSGRGATAHVSEALFGRAALVNGSQRQASGEAAGSGPGIHPRQFVGHQGQGQVLRTGDESTLFGFEKDGGDAGFVEGLQQSGLFRGPLMRIARAGGHQPRYWPARHGASRLHEHLEVVSVGETPQDLAHVVAGEGA